MRPCEPGFSESDETPPTTEIVNKFECWGNSGSGQGGFNHKMLWFCHRIATLTLCGFARLTGRFSELLTDCSQMCVSIVAQFTAILRYMFVRKL